jgi:L-fuconolactonase
VTVIDAHAHLWRRDRTPQPWIDPESMAPIDSDFWVDDLRAMQEATGIDGTIIVQSSNDLAETRDLLEACDGTVIRGIVGWVDLRADAASQIDSLRAGPGGENLVGIRHLAHQDPDPGWLVRDDVDFGALGSAGLPFDLVVLPVQLPLATAAVTANPGVSFVLDHLGKPLIAGGGLDEWRADLERLAALPNVVAKLSGITFEADWQDWSVDDLRIPVQSAIELFGPSRLLFGSDWPLVDLARGSDPWLRALRELTAELSEPERALVFGGTAARIYGVSNA